jgi:hypothetical protein
VAAALPNLHTRALKLGDTTSLAGVWCALLAGFRLTRSTSTASPLDPVEGCAQALLLFLIVLIFLISILISLKILSPRFTVRFLLSQ